MKLSFGLAFRDLYDRDGLLRLDAAFQDFLEPSLRERFVEARQQSAGGQAESELLIALAPHLEDFLAKLFGIEAEAQALAARHHELAPLYYGEAPVRAAARSEGEAGGCEARRLRLHHELEFASAVSEWMKDETAKRWQAGSGCALRGLGGHTPEGKAKHRRGCCSRRRSSWISCAWCRCARTLARDTPGTAWITCASATALP
jgi:hypothetical protein